MLNVHVQTVCMHIYICILVFLCPSHALMCGKCTMSGMALFCAYYIIFENLLFQEGFCIVWFFTIKNVAVHHNNVHHDICVVPIYRLICAL